MGYLDTSSVIQQYVTVMGTFDPKNLGPFKVSANRKFLKPYTGELFTELETAPSITEIKKTKARSLFEEALCCFSFYLGGPEIAVQISNSGISTHSSEDLNKADTFAMNDLNREFLRRGHEALDALLLVLEETPEEFDSYTEELQDSNSDLIVSTTATFQKYYNIQESRQTFIALLPTLRQVEDQYISTVFCTEFINSIKSPGSVGNILKAKEYIQKAIVAFTVSQTVYEGQFILDGRGIHLKFDRLPHESIVTNVNLKINDFLIHTKDSKYQSGIQYLKLAKKIITDNPGDFTVCDGAVIIDGSTETLSGNPAVTNNRIIGL